MKKFKCKESIICQSAETAGWECENDAKYLWVAGGGTFFLCGECAENTKIPGTLLVPIEEIKDWVVK